MAGVPSRPASQAHAVARPRRNFADARCATRPHRPSRPGRPSGGRPGRGLPGQAAAPNSAGAGWRPDALAVTTDAADLGCDTVQVTSTRARRHGGALNRPARWEATRRSCRDERSEGRLGRAGADERAAHTCHACDKCGRGDRGVCRFRLCDRRLSTSSRHAPQAIRPPWALGRSPRPAGLLGPVVPGRRVVPGAPGPGFRHLAGLAGRHGAGSRTRLAPSSGSAALTPWSPLPPSPRSTPTWSEMCGALSTPPVGPTWFRRRAHRELRLPGAHDGALGRVRADAGRGHRAGEPSAARTAIRSPSSGGRSSRRRPRRPGERTPGCPRISTSRQSPR